MRKMITLLIAALPYVVHAETGFLSPEDEVTTDELDQKYLEFLKGSLAFQREQLANHKVDNQPLLHVGMALAYEDCYYKFVYNVLKQRTQEK